MSEATDNSSPSNGIELSAMLKQLRADLEQTQHDGAGSDLKFKIQNIDIELQIVATQARGGGGGVKLSVFNANAKIDHTEAKTQKLKLTLQPVSGTTGEPMKVAGEEEKRPGSN